MSHPVETRDSRLFLGKLVDEAQVVHDFVPRLASRALHEHGARLVRVGIHHSSRAMPAPVAREAQLGAPGLVHGELHLVGFQLALSRRAGRVRLITLPLRGVLRVVAPALYPGDGPQTRKSPRALPRAVLESRESVSVASPLRRSERRSTSFIAAARSPESPADERRDGRAAARPRAACAPLRREDAECEYSDMITVPESPPKIKTNRYTTKFICYHAAQIANETKIAAITTLTQSGYTAFQVSSWRPHSNIIVFTSNKRILCRLNLLWGVKAFYYNRSVSTDKTIQEINEIVNKKGFAKKGDMVINLASMPVKESGMVNTLKISEI